ncbi:MAG: ribonuclease PH [Candidatus Theseobacter exili]|nr:ribonuclease PH [Candidatus Theseobacter exili]
MKRIDGRKANELRPVRIERDFIKGPLGSAHIEFGSTRIICVASVKEETPKWMKNGKTGWITSEYSMMPYSSGGRSPRESSLGKLSGRTQEIQRLIGRSFRSAIDLKKLGERTLWIDCDVLQADGGTRTASITGGFVALMQALNSLVLKGSISNIPVKEPMAAVSVGIVNGTPLLDLCYEEDVKAEVDMNVVMTASGKIIEIQGTAESQPFTRNEFDKLLDLAWSGIQELIKKQNKVLI